MMFGTRAFIGEGDPFYLTSGSNGTPFFYRGFYDIGGAGIGSITPAGITVNGEEIVALYSSTPESWDLNITLDDADANGAITDFRGIRVEDSTGAIRVYMTADAVFDDTGAYAQWMWGDGTDDVYTNEIGTERRFTIFY